jgi:hypothetical protein
MSRLPLLLLPCALFSACKKEEALADKGVKAKVVPSLTITSPEAADWLAPGDVTVEGTSAYVERVDVNGAAAAFSNGDRSWSVPATLERGINLIDARGYEDDGDELVAKVGVLAGTFGDPGVPVEDAMLLRVNQSGIDEILGLVDSYLSVESINDIAVGMGSLYNTGALGLTLDAYIDSIDFGTPTFVATPETGKLHLDVVIPDLLVDMRVEITGWTDGTIPAAVYADSARLSADLLVNAEDGRLSVDMVDPSIELEGFGSDITLPDWLTWVDWVADLFTGTVQGTLEDLLIEQLQTQVPALLDSTLAGLDPSFETELMGKALSLEAAFADADVDRDGITLTLDVNVTMPSDGTQSYQGYLLAAGDAPEVDRTADMAAGVSDDLLNRLLFEVWRAGLLQMEISSEDISLLSLIFEKLHATGGSIALDARLPPVIIEQDGQLQLQVGELDTRITTPDGEFGTELLISMTAFVNIEPKLEDGVLGVELGDADLDLTVKDSNWGVDPDTITNMVNEALPEDQVKLMLNAAVVSLVSIEIPALLGFELDSATVARDAGGAYSDIEADVVYVGVEE